MATTSKMKPVKTKMGDNVVHMFEAPPGERSERDIHIVLPIAMMKTNCFRGLEKSTVADILQKAELLQFNEDDVIVKQGDTGDTFYIILEGKVSVFLDSKHDEKAAHSEENPSTLFAPLRRPSHQSHLSELDGEDMSGSQSAGKASRIDSVQEGKPRRKKSTWDVRDDRHLNRRKYGTCVNILGRYQAFGELALLYPSNKRNASVIADEKTGILAISHEVFSASLQENLERDLDEKRIFIQTHPFFSKWNLPTQRQLQWSLVRSTHRIGDQAIRQGENVSGLHFLVGGRARLAAEPLRHRLQFPDFFAKDQRKPNDKLQLGDTTLSEIVETNRLTKSRRNILAGMDPMTYIRRTDGYAAAEKAVFDKLADLCIIEEGEVICDCELLLSVDKNMFSMICTTACTLFHIDVKIFDRMIYKKNPHTLTMMKFLAETKLTRRISSKQGQKMPILAPLLFKILELRVVDPLEEKHGLSKMVTTIETLPRISMVPKIDRSKTLLIDWYIQGRTPFLRPITKDAIYYRDMIQKRAKSREIVRQKGPKEMREVKSLARRVKDSYWYNLKESVRAQNTMKRLKLQNSDSTPVSRWK